MKLNTTKIRNAAPQEKPYRLTDGRGLSLLVTPSGSKLWQWVYREDGKQRTKSIGPFPEVTLQQAREAVIDGRRAQRVGVPMVPVKGKTFGDAWVEHLRVWETGKDMAHIMRVKARMETDTLPFLGKMELDKIKPVDVVEVVRKVEARGALDVSRRLKQKIGEVFGFAIAMGWCENDPTTHVNRVLRPRPPVEHMARVPLVEMPKLVTSLAKHPDELVRIGLRFTLLTAARSAEVREAQWSEIQGDRWVIPAARMKAGREHIVPMSRQTVEVVERLRKFRRNEYLFPGPRRAVANTNFLINGLYDLGWRERQTVHGFRGLFSTWANENDWNRDVVERALAHVEENKVRGAYNAAELIDQRTKLLQAWADQIDEWAMLGMLE